MALMAVQCENPAPHAPPGRPPRNRQHWIDRQRGRRWQAASCWFRGSHDSPIRFIFQIGTLAVGVAFIHKTETPFAGRLCGSSLRYYAVYALSDYSVAVVTAGERYTEERFIHSTFHKADKRSLRVVRVLTNKVQTWLKDHHIKTIYIDPGSPWQNGYIERFHSRFRDECLNREWLLNLREARVVIEDWRQHYNTERPHSRLGYLSPEEFIQTKILTS